MDTITHLIDQQKDNATKLFKLLEQEKVAIVKRDTKNIEQLANDKLSLINLLQQTDSLIGEHQDVTEINKVPTLSDKVTEVRKLIGDCQRANDINGEALQRAQLSFNKLNNLMKQSQNKLGVTYTAEGQTKGFNTLGTNVKA